VNRTYSITLILYGGFLLSLFMVFMHDIYSYIHETNRVCRLCSVAAVLVFTVCAACNVFSHLKCVLYLNISAVCECVRAVCYCVCSVCDV
jgi:hypothetical protein